MMNSKLKPHRMMDLSLMNHLPMEYHSDELEWESSEWERLQSDDGSDRSSGGEESEGDQEVDGGVKLPTTLA